ncbi:ribosome maturation factor RimM [Bacilli bacterium]|nr:ribosome maturation factor RimM [Bacilli bacterium]
MLQIGKILSTHGLEGNVKIISFFEEPEDIFKYEIMDKDKNTLKCKKVGLTNKKDVFLAKFERINSIDEAKKYNGIELFTPSQNLPATLENEVYLEHLIGMAVVGGNKAGIVESISNYGAGYILEIEWNNGKSESILYTDNFVKNVDKKNRIITIDLPSYI